MTLFCCRKILKQSQTERKTQHLEDKKAAFNLYTIGLLDLHASGLMWDSLSKAAVLNLQKSVYIEFRSEKYKISDKILHDRLHALSPILTGRLVLISFVETKKLFSIIQKH